MSGQVKNYYAAANTAKGCQKLFESNIKDLDKLFILQGGPGIGKSSLMKKVGNTMLKKDYAIEYLHCPSDNGAIDGVIIRTLGVGIVDGAAIYPMEPQAPGAIEEYINLNAACDCDKLALDKAELVDLKTRINACYPMAYDQFKQALLIHDEWEKIYIDNMDFKKADELTQLVIARIIGEISYSKKSVIRHRFFGASTPKGPVDFVPLITQDLSKRYFIKGRPGSGKSTMLKKILLKAESCGLDAEVYHCGFDPNSLDMILLPELDLCLFDSTAPHEYYPEHMSDEIIDMYHEIITPGTDEKYKADIDAIKARYKDCIQTGINYLAQAKTLHDALEKYYTEATDFSIINEIYGELIDKIILKKVSQ
ncbi:PRK06851 family protein [Cellulosilyticum sp. I15G10I2]|uniref:PRK06851 family protein n=1 Tax=Cellulosilyticum sp. I15G10I2 TaxID=1892843 RepID=UPI00085C4D08|nr:PRK06851 family protein [Cellulosilyticum sp. I15G10I2]